MIENENLTDAVRVVTALARFFRISLSRGKSIIAVRDELEHVRNYLMIQHMRYKNKFTYTVEAEDEVLDLASLKLILQPLVENAIYHGMEFMDGDGEIRIRAWRQDKDLFMSVSDNGLGLFHRNHHLRGILFHCRLHGGRSAGFQRRTVDETDFFLFISLYLLPSCSNKS